MQKSLILFSIVFLAVAFARKPRPFHSVESRYADADNEKHDSVDESKDFEVRVRLRIK